MSRSIAFLLLALLTACGDDESEGTTVLTTAYTTANTTVAGTSAESSGATGADSPTSAESGSTEVGTSMTGTASVDDGTTASTMTTVTAGATSMGLDCTAPMDCETCWQCAVTEGPCAAGYDACLMNAFCVPTLACIESMCTAGALAQECLDTCCMSCVNLMTCNMVDPTVQCVANTCAGVCGAPTCP